MFRNFSLVILAFVVLGTAPLDAQLFRRVRSAVQKARDSNSDIQRQNQLRQQQLEQQQKLAQQGSTKQPTDATKPVQRGSTPGLAKPKPATEADEKQRFAIFVDGRTGRRIKRPVESAPISEQNSPQLANREPAPANQNTGSSMRGQFDIAREAVKQTASTNQNDSKSNKSVMKDSNVVRASNSDAIANKAPKESKIKKFFSILEPKETEPTEPEKPKPVTIPELDGPAVIKKK